MHRMSTVEGELFFSVPHVCVHVHAYLHVCVCVFLFFVSKDTSDNPNQVFYGKEKTLREKTNPTDVNPGCYFHPFDYTCSRQITRLSLLPCCSMLLIFDLNQFCQLSV